MIPSDRNEVKIKLLFNLIERMDYQRAGNRRYAAVVKIGDWQTSTPNYNLADTPFLNQIEDELGFKLGHIAFFASRIPQPGQHLKWEKIFHKQFTVRGGEKSSQPQSILRIAIDEIETEMLMSGLAQIRIKYESIHG